MSESPPSSSIEPSIHKLGLGLFDPATMSSDPVSGLVVNGGEDVVMCEKEEELRGEIEREIYTLTLEQAEIEETRDLGEVEKPDLVGEEKSVAVVGGFEGQVNKADLVDVVVESELGKTDEYDPSEEKKSSHVVEGVEGGVESHVEKGVDGVVSTERDLGKDGEEKTNVDTVESVDGDFVSRVEKADLGEEKEIVDVVVESVGGEIESDVGEGDLSEEKKEGNAIENVEGGFGSEIGKSDLGEEKETVNVAESVEGAFESEIGKSDLGEEETVNVAESVEGAFESEIGKSDRGDEKETVNVAESVEASVESEIGKFDLGEEKETVNVAQGGWGLSNNFNEGKNAGSVEEDHDKGVGDEESVGDQSGDGAAKVASYNQNSNNRKSNYPMRPDAEDCTYYMKFGTCKFGLHCKFNHPPKRKTQGMKERVKQSVENSERMGQTECKYHMTSGGCKYGKNCKYYHGTENSSISLNPELNFLGLPIRLGEKECPYYMRTGSCKYGSNCRFHHPEPTTVGGGDPGYGNGGMLPSKHVPASTVPSWSSPRAFSESIPYAPVLFPQNHSAPTPKPEWNPSPNPEWNGYQAPAYQTSERGLPTPPAFALKNLSTEINFPLPPLSMMVDEYPERPGEPECSFFMKTGDCKYKSGCKFNHPKNRASKPKPRASPGPSMLSDKGLPLRPDQPICSHFHQYGICKYGPACRYDHPSNVGGLLPPPLFNQPPPFDGADRSRKGNKNGIAA